MGGDLPLRRSGRAHAGRGPLSLGMVRVRRPRGPKGPAGGARLPLPLFPRPPAVLRGEGGDRPSGRDPGDRAGRPDPGVRLSDPAPRVRDGGPGPHQLRDVDPLHGRRVGPLGRRRRGELARAAVPPPVRNRRRRARAPGAGQVPHADGRRADRTRVRSRGGGTGVLLSRRGGSVVGRDLRRRQRPPVRPDRPRGHAGGGVRLRLRERHPPDGAVRHR